MRLFSIRDGLERRSFYRRRMETRAPRKKPAAPGFRPFGFLFEMGAKNSTIATSIQPQRFFPRWESAMLAFILRNP